jgi:hypothetical membrane protein
MNQRNAVWLKISGICGILTPIVACAFILPAIVLYPQFSWTANALSDLGVVSGATAILFNSGLVISGVLALLFASGLFIVFRENMLGRIGASIFLLGALALIAIGIFPENVKPMHYYVSVTFFVLLPISMFMIGAAFLSMARLKTGVFTFLLAMFAVIVWVVQFSARFVSGVAIPETLSALSASTWSVVLGFKMLQEISHSSD